MGHDTGPRTNSSAAPSSSHGAARRGGSPGKRPATMGLGAGRVVQRKATSPGTGDDSARGMKRFGDPAAGPDGPGDVPTAAGGPRDLAPGSDAGVLDDMAPGMVPGTRIVSSTGPFNDAGESREGGAFTQELIETMQMGASLDGALDEVVDMEVHPRLRQLPTEVKVGEKAAQPGGFKRAVYVANQHYRSPTFNSLSGAIADAEGMNAVLSGQGFASEEGVQQDLTGDQLVEAFTEPLTSGDMPPGSELVMYFAGHGDIHGLVGVDNDSGADGMPHSMISGLVPMATSQEIGLRVILDACKSGLAGDTARDEIVNGLRPEGRGLLPELITAVQELTTVRNEYVRFQLRNRFPDEADTRGTRARVFGRVPTARLIDSEKQSWWESRAQPIMQRCAELLTAIGGFMNVPADAREMFHDANRRVDLLDDAINNMLAAIGRMSPAPAGAAR